MENQQKIIKLTLGLAIGIVALMGIVYAYDVYFDLNLYKLGVYPRKLSGLVGIITSPFIHSSVSYSHILNNTPPIFVLTWLLFYNFRNIAPKVFVFTYLSTGLLVWLFARESYHIGMSGVIYGLTSFLMISGFLTKNLRVAGISLLVIFLYGSLVWGIFPQTSNISWEGHFFGFFTGIALAFIYRKQLPQPAKFRYEIEEELGIEPEEEYWREDYVPQQPVSPDPLRVIYTIRPKTPIHGLPDQTKNNKEEE